MKLEARALVKRFQGRSVLAGADLTVADGEFVSIMGPSGGGKSTLARILCGTIQPDGGTVTLDGETAAAPGVPYNRRLRRRIQLIPQQPYAALDPRQRVGDAIAEPLLCHNLAPSREEARRQAAALLERVWLDPALARRRPGELSGGQAQRVLIARSLTLSPRLLIADEATSMLDISSQSQVVHILRELVRERRLSILLITHDRALAESVSQRIYVMGDGVLTEIR